MSQVTSHKHKKELFVRPYNDFSCVLCLVSCVFKNLLISGIKAYQCLSRALLVRHCRFYPSCSQYALEAIERFGIARGAIKVMARILRCSPANHGGYDPVK